MAYQNNIPQANQRLKDSQQDILDNFAAIKTLVDVNHVTFDAAGQGKHKFVSMPEQGAAPATLANEMALYTKEVAGASQLFLRNENNGTEVDFTSATKATTGETTLPSGVILKWGTSATDGAGDATIVFANPFTTIFTIQASESDAAGTSASGTEDAYVRVYTYNNAQFQVVGFRLNSFRTRLAVPFHWFAIGV